MLCDQLFNARTNRVLFIFLLLIINLIDQIQTLTVLPKNLMYNEIQTNHIKIFQTKTYQYLNPITYKNPTGVIPKIILGFSRIQYQIEKNVISNSIKIQSANQRNFSIRSYMYRVNYTVPAILQVYYSIIHENAFLQIKLQMSNSFIHFSLTKTQIVKTKTLDPAVDPSKTGVFCVLYWYRINLEQNQNTIDISLDCQLFLNQIRQTLKYPKQLYTDGYIQYFIVLYENTKDYQIKFFFFEFGPQKTTMTFNQSLDFNRTIIGLAGFNQDLGNRPVNQNFSLSRLNSSAIQLIIAKKFTKMKFFCIIFSFKKCPYTHIFSKKSTNQCFDECQDRQYENYSSLTCMDCPRYCLLCNLNQECLKCDDHDKRKLEGINCVAIEGYFDNGVQIAQKCDKSCAQCVIQKKKCNKCAIHTHYPKINQIPPYQCLQCRTSMPNCKLCLSHSICFQCDEEYELIRANQCQLKQSIIHCLQAYYLINGECQSRCGDAIIVSGTEQCDDGNSHSYDGCSSLCRVQTGFLCTLNKEFKPYSHCLYTDSFKTSLISIKKNPNQNKVEIYLFIERVQLLINHKIPLFYILKVQTQIKMSNYSAQILSNSTNYNAIVIISYINTIHLQQVMIKINPIWVNQPLFSKSLSQKLSIIIQPSNHLTAEFYSASQYYHSEILKYVNQVLSYLFLIIFIIGIVLDARIISIDMIGAAQLLYFSLLPIGFMNPIVMNLLYLKKTVDIVVINNSNPVLNKETSLPIKGLLLHNSFIQNCNIMIILFIGVPFLVGVISLILLKLNIKFGRSQLQTLNNKCFKQFIIYGLMINSFFIGASISIQGKYVFNNLTNINNIISLILMIIIVTILIFYSGWFLFKQKMFPELIEFLDYKNKISFCYIFPIILWMRMLFGFILVLLYYIVWINAIVIVGNLSLIILVIIKWPFKIYSNNIRLICNQAINIVIQFHLIYYAIVDNLRNDEKTAGLYFPYNIATLLFIILIYNAILIGMVGFNKISSLKILNNLQYKSIDQKNLRQNKLKKTLSNIQCQQQSVVRFQKISEVLDLSQSSKDQQIQIEGKSKNQLQLKLYSINHEPDQQNRQSNKLQLLAKEKNLHLE